MTNAVNDILVKSKKQAKVIKFGKQKSQLDWKKRRRENDEQVVWMFFKKENVNKQTKMFSLFVGEHLKF